MATTHERIAGYYHRGDLLPAIEAGLAAMGKGGDGLHYAELAPVDQFHIGGQEATRQLAAALGIAPGLRVLDVGCGLGGPARQLAAEHNCHVTGVDLCAEYVEVARALSRRVALDGRTAFHAVSAEELSFPPGSFDAAIMLHVGMNIPDKAGVFAGVRRLLKDGARFGMYEILRKQGGGDIAYPVPWAGGPDMCFAAGREAYEEALSAAGFYIESVRDSTAEAIAFFERVQARIERRKMPPLSLQLVMGADFGAKVGNMLDNLRGGAVAPSLVVAVAD